MGQTEGLKKYRNLKKDRARLLTVLSEKKAGSEAAVAEVKAADAEKKKRSRKA
jgi:hypothetical protein